MSDRPDPHTTSEPELELASDLAHHIAGRAAEDGYRERLWIHAAARLIELLLSGSAVELDFAEARSHLQRVQVAARLPGREARPTTGSVTSPRRGGSSSLCEARRRREH
jgi:hypothetical protein